MAGQENYLYLTQENYYDGFQDSLIKTADKYHLEKNFGIGKKVDQDKLRHDQMFYDILCTDSCELIDWVQKKIDGELECDKTSNTTDFTYNTNCYQTDAVTQCCNWESLQW